MVGGTGVLMSASWAHLQLVHTNPGSAWRKTPAGLVAVPVDFVPEGDWGAHLDVVPPSQMSLFTLAAGGS